MSTPSSAVTPPYRNVTRRSDATALPAARCVGTAARAEGPGESTGVAHRQGQRIPAERAPESHDGRADRGGAKHLGGRSGLDAAGTVEEHHPVDQVHDPLQAMLGDHDGHGHVVDQTREARQHVLGGDRVEGRCRFVQHQQARRRGEHRSDRNPLLLTPRQCRKGPVAQLRDAEEVEGLLDASAHYVGGNPEVLHGVGKFVLDDVGDERGGRVLADIADRVGQVARPMRRGVASGNDDPPRERAAREVGDESARGAQQGRLARTGLASDEHELALVDKQVDLRQRGSVAALVGDAHASELERRGHVGAATSAVTATGLATTAGR